MPAPLITVTPSAALQAYWNTDNGQPDVAAGTNFGSMLRQALEGAVDAGRAAEMQASGAISGTAANITDVVTAVSKAELALQTTVTIRDRVVQAYQDIMRMPI